jgi:hypothetical protein
VHCFRCHAVTILHINTELPINMCRADLLFEYRVEKVSVQYEYRVFHYFVI